MPIQILDYTWRQTPEKVTLTVDLHCTSPKKVDIITTRSYLKVSFLPYICEIFLCHLIKVDQSSARIQQGNLELNLVKAEAQLWKELGLKLTKEEMEYRRQEAIKDVAEEEKRKTEQRKEDCIKREKFAVSQQILVDDQVRAEYSRMVQREKAEFFQMGSFQESDKEQSGTHSKNYIQETVKCISQNGKLETEEPTTIPSTPSGGLGGQTQRGRASSTCSEEGTEATQEADYDGDGEDSIHYSSTENLHFLDGNIKHDKQDMKNRKQRKSSANRKTAVREKENKKRSNLSAVPPVRSGGTICVTHTPRVFPSPARESTQKQEQQWLKAQTGISSAQHNTGMLSSQYTEEHFKSKAVTLFSSGDYQGCVNACTEGLRINPASPAFYSNRAAAHLALRNLHHTIKDCSKALELLTPPTQDNSNSRLLCHIRRGTALVQLSLLSEGLTDYQAALQLNPENKALCKDVERIYSMLMASTDSNEDSGCEAEGDRGASNSASS